MNIVTVKRPPTPAKRALGARIAHWRQQQKDIRGLSMTQADFARLLGVHYSTVSLWEAGRAAPGPDMMRRILRRLRISVSKFYEPRVRVPREDRAA